MIQISDSVYKTVEMFDGDAMVEDRKWYKIGELGMVRPLVFDVKNGGWISVLKAQGEGTIQRHRHAAPVTAWTMAGTWGYREHDWIARAGSFVYEPAGHIHTLYIHPEQAHMTALFHVMGPLLYVDGEGRAEHYEDVFVRLDRYAEHCRRVGLGEDWVRSLIR